MELVGTCVVGKGIEGNVVGEVIQEELVRASNVRSEASARGSLGPEKRREGHDGFGDRNVQREALRRLGKHHVVQTPKRPCTFIPRVYFVGFETAAQSLIQRRPRFVDEPFIEREELECSRSIAPQIAVHLAWLRQAERPWRLHALATVDARDRATTAREAHAVVRFHSAMELRGLSKAEVGDAGTDESRLGIREHSLHYTSRRKVCLCILGRRQDRPRRQVLRSARSGV